MNMTVILSNKFIFSTKLHSLKVALISSQVGKAAAGGCQLGEGSLLESMPSTTQDPPVGSENKHISLFTLPITQPGQIIFQLLD